MKRLRTLLALLAAMACLNPVYAQDEATYDRIDLNANTSAEVENDLLIAVVFAEVEDNDQADAAAAVNESIAWAAGRAREVAGIDIQTSNYNTRPVYANGRRIVGWVARQSLQLESADAEALSELLGELQQRVAIQSINYGLSDTARETAEEALIARALAQFNRRATLIASELGREGFKIVRLSVGSSGVNPAQFMDMSVRSVSALEFSAPEIEAGRQTLTVNVSGTVELLPAP